jgi:dynein heavy chain
VGYPELNEMKDELERLSRVYELYTEQHDFVEQISQMLWSDLDLSVVIKAVGDLEVKLRKFPKDLKAMPTYQLVEERVTAFRDSIPLIQLLKNDALKPRHWTRLMEVTGVQFTMNPKTFTLGNLFSMQLHRFSDAIGEIVNQAMQEQKIENEIRKIEDKWRVTLFELAKYKKGNDDKGWVLRSADDIKVELEDHMLNLQTMGGSRFAREYQDTIRGWEKKLNHVNECIDVWFKVQSKWMYLESILVGAEDIRQQLPEEAKRFDAIDKRWRAIMASAAKNPNVVETCHAEQRVEVLGSLSDALDSCQKSLSDYLETKRNSFPRFFFISDDELLSVLGNADPTAIQVHLLKLYSNTDKFKFGRGAKSVVGMVSSEGESFDFGTPTAVEGPVETWMTAVEDEMKASLHTISKEGIFNYAKTDRLKWVDQSLGMVGLLGSSVWWTWETEDVFRRVVQDGDKYAMKNFEVKLTGQLSSLVGLVRQNISKNLRKKCIALLILDVHARDIISQFVRDSILDAREFAWESQLRFYWDKSEDDVRIRQCTGQFSYGFEFMGLNGRLVITPLTDRCYMTITQALTFNLGTSPAGPAGTGKTETVKDLSKALALPCFVINWCVRVCAGLPAPPINCHPLTFHLRERRVGPRQMQW